MSGSTRMSLDQPHNRQTRLAQLAADTVTGSLSYRGDSVIVFIFGGDSMGAGLAGCSLHEAQARLPQIRDTLNELELKL